MKELQIIAPEGYEVDKEKSTFEKIVFKKKNDKPMSWEEFCAENPNAKNEYYINSLSEVMNVNSQHSTMTAPRRSEEDRNFCKTEEEAEAFLALIQLKRLWHEWKDDTDGRINYTRSVVYYNYIDRKWCVGKNVKFYTTLFQFYSEETAKLFLEAFKDLFDKVKVLYE